eukprot:27355_1
MSFSVVKLEHIHNENIKLMVFGYIRSTQELFPASPFYNISPSITRIILTYYYAPALMPGRYTMDSTEPGTKFHPGSDPWTATYSLKIDHDGTVTGTRQETTSEHYQYNDNLEGYIDYDGNISFECLWAGENRFVTTLVKYKLKYDTKQKQVIGTWDCSQVDHGKLTASIIINPD